MQRVCRNVVPAGWQVCLFQPAVIQLSVRLLTRSYLYASQSWHLNAVALVTGGSGSYCVVRAFTSTTSGYTAFITLTA
jgi:hypothetical protein